MVSPIFGCYHFLSPVLEIHIRICRYGWRYQIGPWVRRGHRVVVLDMLGYGGSDKPENPSEYSAKKLCADLAALLDLLGVSQAVSRYSPEGFNC